MEIFILTIISRMGNVNVLDSISKISSNPEINKSMANSNMPWIVALLIGAGTIIINLLISQRQLTTSRKLLDIRLKGEEKKSILEIKKSVLSDNRQRWINELRDCVSEFLAIHTFLSSSNILEFYAAKKNEEVKLKAKTLEQKIQLLLNPNEDDSVKLIKMISKLPYSFDINQDDSDYQVFQNLSDEIVKMTQKILKIEWERVKNLK